MQVQMLFSILLLAPLVGFAINGLRWRSHQGVLAGIIGSVAVGISFLSAVKLVLMLFGEGAPPLVGVQFFDWLTVGELNLKAGFVIDRISAIMVLVVTGVGTLIHIFSIGYMSHDERPSKYFAYLNLFLFNMLLLILGDNLIILFMGWEGVGLCSYLLIGFWFKDSAKAAAGMKAFIANRIGDAGFLIGMFLLFYMFGTLNFSEILGQVPQTQTFLWSSPITLACLALFIGATGKSAQLPLYVWLPDAMAGPTPVSALIHAATMVTAGVYMIIRLGGLYLAAPNALLVVAIIGGLTAVLAATIGLTQWDIKKVLAYSTVSQLGYMFLACGVGAFGAALFHLMTHAFFKALMFLGSGSVIHAMHEEQDIRKMGGLKKYLPITHLTFFIGWLAIIGAPPFAGFFSKDEILWKAFSSPLGHPALWMMGLIGAACTAFYMTRLMALTFWGGSRVPKDVHPHESPAVMTFPLIVLAILSVVGGWIGIPHVLGEILPGHPGNWLEHWLVDAVPQVQGAHGSAALEMVMMVLSVLIAGVSAAAAIVIYIHKPDWPKQNVPKWQRLYDLVYDKYRVDEFYQGYVIDPLVRASRGAWAYVDVLFIDRITYWCGDLVRHGGAMVRSLQSGNMQQYALYIALGVVASLYWMMR